MKIKQIRRTGPELYLVTYITRWLRRDVERWVIAAPQREELVKIGHTKTYFYFRDGNSERAFDCIPHLEWMIRNKIDFFDNSQSPDPMWPRSGDKIEPYYPTPITLRDQKHKGAVPNIPTVPPIPTKRNIPDFNKYIPLPEKPETVLTLSKWERREPRVFITPATTEQYDIDEAQKQVRKVTSEFFHQNGRTERDLETRDGIKRAIDIAACTPKNEAILKELYDIPALNPEEDTHDTSETKLNRI